MPRCQLVPDKYTHRAMLHDPRRYPDPDEFIPERFLDGDATNEGVIDPNNIIFGFGRRCVIK